MISFTVFVFGLAIGSFLNALIHRLEKGESAFRGRSYCPRCKHPLDWYDLIPLLSFMMLRGRCRYCQDKISFQYPLVELATGIVFVLIFNFSPFGGSPAGGQLSNLLYLWIVSALLIVIFVYDLRYFLIPDKILYPAIGIAVLWRIFEFLSFQGWDLIRNLKLEIRNFETLFYAMTAGLAASAFFLAIYLLSRGRAMGFGDVKLAFLLGLFLGWPSILVALSLAFSIGAVSGLVLIALKKKGLKSEVPFAPFLIIGTAITFFFGSALLDWYFKLFLV